MDKLIVLFKDTFPEECFRHSLFEAFDEFTPNSFYSNEYKKFMVSKFDGGSIWSSTGICQLPNWRAEEVYLILSDLTRPIENKWESDHQQVADERIKLEGFVEGVEMNRE